MYTEWWYKKNCYLVSCHDIGRGMNSVIEVVIGLYDDGKIS